jgi:peptidoglycan/xylan/chitin deacetylase (PgdA/CDA1 family)
VPTNLPLVALSFDDGPHPVYTPQVLEILQRHGARATFFLIGDRALRHPEIVEQIKASGSEVGNHYFYTRMGTMMSHSDEEFLRNLARVEQAIGLADGPKVFRAPGGIARPRQLTLARERGYTCAWLARHKKSKAGDDHRPARRNKKSHPNNRSPDRHPARRREARPPLRFDWRMTAVGNSDAKAYY